MGAETNDSILLEPIETLPFSDAFKQMAARHGFDTLEQLLSLRVAQLHKKKGFTMHVYDELITFLKQCGLMDRLKQRRGQ